MKVKSLARATTGRSITFSIGADGRQQREENMGLGGGRLLTSAVYLNVVLQRKYR
jgi:hypothetical protein